MPRRTLLVIAITALCSIGLVMVYSSSYIFAIDKYGDGLYLFKRQALALLAGLSLLFAATRYLNPASVERWARPLILICMLLLGAIMIPGLGWRSGGATRWLNLGLFRFQPSEFIKGSVVIYLAYAFSQDKFTLKRFWPLIPVSLLLLLQPDFGTTAILSMVFMGLFFLRGKNLKAFFAMIALIGGAAATLIMTSPYRRQRVLTFLNPWSDPDNSGFQIIQSFLGFTSGKFWGVGIGNGKEKLFYLPAVHNDFIFSVVGEELGFLGVVLVISLFMTFLYCGFKVASEHDGFKSYLAAGLTLLIGVQAVVNIGVVLGLLPTKGLTLPFISYGGTAMIANLLWIGILLTLCREDGAPDGGEVSVKSARRNRSGRVS